MIKSGNRVVGIQCELCSPNARRAFCECRTDALRFGSAGDVAALIVVELPSKEPVTRSRRTHQTM